MAVAVAAAAAAAAAVTVAVAVAVAVGLGVFPICCGTRLGLLKVKRLCVRCVCVLHVC